MSSVYITPGHIWLATGLWAVLRYSVLDGIQNVPETSETASLQGGESSLRNGTAELNGVVQAGAEVTGADYDCQAPVMNPAGPS